MNYGSLQREREREQELEVNSDEKRKSALHFSDSQQKNHKKFLGKKL